MDTSSSHWATINQSRLLGQRSDSSRIADIDKYVGDVVRVGKLP